MKIQAINLNLIVLILISLAELNLICVKCSEENIDDLAENYYSTSKFSAPFRNLLYRYKELISSNLDSKRFYTKTSNY